MRMSAVIEPGMQVWRLVQQRRQPNWPVTDKSLVAGGYPGIIASKITKSNKVIGHWPIHMVITNDQFFSEQKKNEKKCKDGLRQKILKNEHSEINI